MKRSKKSKKTSKAFIAMIFAIVAVILVGVGAIIFVIKSPKSNGSDFDVNEAKKIEEEVANLVASKSSGDNEKLIEAMGGDKETFYKLSDVLYTFSFYIDHEQWEKAYDLYAVKVIESAGYKYSYEAFVSDMQKLRYSLLDGTDGTICYNTSYYKDYGHYYILHGSLYGYYDMKTVNTMEMGFTIIATEEGDYRILDFSWSNISAVANRFETDNEDLKRDGLIIAEDNEK